MKLSSLGLAATLAFSVAPAQAASPITFNITAESGAGALPESFATSYTSFVGGDKLNMRTVVSEETFTFGGYRHVYRWSDTTYDQQGGYRDTAYWLFYDGDAAHAPDYVYFKATASIDPEANQSVPMTITTSSSVSGTYSGVSDPRFPNVSLYPGTVTVAAANSHNPVDLINISSYGSTSFYPDGTFYSNVYYGDLVVPPGGTADMSVLFYLPSQLYATSYSFNMSTPLYDEGLHHFSERTYLDFQILPVPEPSTWAMLLAGVGILGIARRRKNAA